MAVGSDDDIRVLHVDDEPRFAEIVTTHLERTSDRIAVRTETDADDALAVVRSDQTDCVVSDHDMPSMTGLELLRAVREENPDLPFVLFTGKGSEEIASEAISAGVTDYIQKGGGSEQYELLANRIENAVSGRHMESAFQAEHEKLTSLFANSPDPIVECRMADGEAIVEAVNPAFEAVFGEDGASVVGEPLDDLIVPSDRRDEARALNRRAEAGTQFRTEVRRLAADGPRTFLLTSVPLPSIGVGYAIYADVTEVRERERRLETLISNLPGMVYRCANEPDWPMEFVGGDCEELSGYTAEEIESGEVHWGADVIHADDETRVWDAVQAALKRREPFELVYRIGTKDGGRRWCWEQGRGVYDADADLVALEGFILDVTDYREMESALRECRRVLGGENSGDRSIDGARARIDGVLDGLRLETGWLPSGDDPA